MSDAAPEQQKQPHGARFYVGWLLLLYLVSFLPAYVLLRWLHFTNRMPRLSSVVETVYRPIRWVVFEVLDFGETLEPIVQAALRVLPRP